MYRHGVISNTTLFFNENEAMLTKQSNNSATIRRFSNSTNSLVITVKSRTSVGYNESLQYQNVTIPARQESEILGCLL